MGSLIVRKHFSFSLNKMCYKLIEGNATFNLRGVRYAYHFILSFIYWIHVILHLFIEKLEFVFKKYLLFPFVGSLSLMFLENVSSFHLHCENDNAIDSSFWLAATSQIISIIKTSCEWNLYSQHIAHTIVYISLK